MHPCKMGGGIQEFQKRNPNPFKEEIKQHLHRALGHAPCVCKNKRGVPLFLQKQWGAPGATPIYLSLYYISKVFYIYMGGLLPNFLPLILLKKKKRLLKYIISIATWEFKSKMLDEKYGSEYNLISCNNTH